jgi:hypothetical protein
LQQALSAAAARWTATNERERVYRVDEAIRHLAVYVVTSIVIGTRGSDMRLLESLPGLLEPFAGLSPALHAMWQNVIALNERTLLGRRASSARRARDVYEHLSRLNEREVPYVNSIRHAVANSIGWFEASLGRPAARQWAEVLDGAPQHRVAAMEIRCAASLMQGDAEAAEHFRKQSELLALRTSTRQMFEKTWAFDLDVGVLTGDLACVKRVIDGITPLAARLPGWIPMLHAAEGHFRLLRGDRPAALGAFERCMAVSDPERPEPPPQITVWVQAVAGAITALTELDRSAEAIALGERALRTCEARGAEICWHRIARALALAEGRHGELTRATARIEALIETERQDGVIGLSLAASYEARARIAIWARDADAAARYASLSVRERGGPSASAAAPRVVRLLEEARGFGLDVELELTDFEASVLGTTRASTTSAAPDPASRCLDGCATAAQRAERALELLCGLARAPRGQLYLVGDDGELAPVAARNAAAPAPAALRFARAFFAQQIDDELLSAGLTQATRMLSLPGVGSHIDADGAEHHLLLLSCKQAGVLVYVGLAVVAASRDAGVDPGVVLHTSAIAAALLRAGDSPGTRAESQD